MNTTSGKTVFVLGRNQDGNRTAIIADTGKEYTIDPATRYAYTEAVANFPYTV